jgi:hypothetical protein
MVHCCVWQGLPCRLIVSDSGDIEAAGRGSLFRTQRRHTGLQIIYRFTPPLQHRGLPDYLNVPLTCSIDEADIL